MKSWIRVVGVLVGLAGCGPSGPAGSCRIPATSTSAERCIYFTEGYTVDGAREACDILANSTYSDMECPTANRIGRCRASSPDGAFTQELSFYAPMMLSAAMTSCTQAKGTFTAD